MPATFHSRHIHDLNYYKKVLLALVKAIRSKERYDVLAAKLNGSLLLSPQGGEWSTVKVRQLLKRLRSPQQYRTSFYPALLELHIAGEIAADDVAILITSPRVVS